MSRKSSDAFAHSLPGRPPDAWQPLEAHAANVAEMAAACARPFASQAWARLLGELHDLGKTRRGYAFIYGNADDWDVIRDCHKKSMREAMSEILAAREAERAEREAKGEPAPSRRTDPPPSKADPGLAMPRKHGVELTL